MQAILYPTADGVAVVIPTGELPIEEVIAKDVPAGVPHKLVAPDAIPDRYFRAAWRFDAETGAKVDLPAAKEIQRNKWRAAREPKLAALDVEFMRAVETGNAGKQAQLAAAKQALRDVTKTALPDDLAGIKAAWPAVLA